MKIQNLGHGASFLLLILGLVALGFGLHIVESNAFGAWIVSVLFGVPLILFGGLVVIAIIIVWIPQILIQVFGVYVGLGILAGLLLTAYLLYELKPAWLYEPLNVNVVKGSMYDQPGFTFNKSIFYLFISGINHSVGNLSFLFCKKIFYYRQSIWD